jgi:DNA-binding transcriptional MocR family regulator
MRTLSINRDSNCPIYQQIIAQVKHQISIGGLPAGTRLPPVRQLAEELGVTRLTVHNAYAELQTAGWVEATVGKGTYVRAGIQSAEMVAHHLALHHNAKHYCADMSRIMQLGTVRTLAYAVPDGDLIPGEELVGIMNQLRHDAAMLMHYGEQEGDSMLRVEIARLLADRGIEAMPDEVLITNGATQGLALIVQSLVGPDDCVLLEQPIYIGQIKVFDALGIKAIGVPMDGEGPRLDILEQLIIKHRPRFFSTIPNFHNPTGIVMSQARRIALLDLARRYELPIVEDDVFALLSYDGPPPLALKALDRDNLVITISSLSKILAPGLRIGILVAPPPLHQKMVNLKWAIELSGTTITQRAMACYLQDGRLKSHLRRVLPIYRDRRDALMRSLNRHMPDGVTWTHPAGGFGCWVSLPKGGSYDDLYPTALKRDVAFTPNEAFFTEPDSGYHMRLCFGNQPPSVIDEAVALIAELVRERLPKRTFVPRPTIAQDQSQAAIRVG